MNIVILHGHLARNPEIRSTSSGTSVARFTIAVNRRSKDGGADFISCVAFERCADFVEKYCPKGKEVCIDGHIQTGSYENREGKKVYTTDVICDHVELAGKREDGASAAPKPREKQEDNPYLDEDPGFKQLDLSGLDDVFI